MPRTYGIWMILSTNQVKTSVLPLALIYSNISWYFYTENTIFKWIYATKDLYDRYFYKIQNRSGYSTKIYTELFFHVKSKLKIPCKTLRGVDNNSSFSKFEKKIQGKKIKDGVFLAKLLNSSSQFR